jgi:hypothetical protein
MEAFEIPKQMISLQKTTFDNAFNAMILIQDQTEKMASTLLDQTPWLPKEGQKTINEWTAAFKKGRDDFKKAVDESFEKMEAFLPEYGKEKKAKASQTPAKQAA